MLRYGENRVILPPPFGDNTHNSDDRASAWWGFTTASDRQRLEAVIRRAKRSWLCSSDLPSLAELIDSADDELFHSILYNPCLLYTSDAADE